MPLLSLPNIWRRLWLKDPAYKFLFDPPPENEVVSIDCETTGLDRRRDDIITIAAVKIRGARILTSERFEVVVKPSVKIHPDAIKIHKLRERDVAEGQAMAEALPKLLKFIGSRPLVGYYLEFDCAMINRAMRRHLRIGLPNPRIEVSGMFYDRKYGDAPAGTHVDLAFQTILRDLKLPTLAQHDAYADALMTAMIYVALRDYEARNIRIPRLVYNDVTPFSAG